MARIYGESLSGLQRRMLSLLEEAGEENVSSLMNCSSKWKGTPSELEIICSSIIGLIKGGFVRMAVKREKRGHRLVAEPKESSLKAVDSVRSCLSWSYDEGMWKWRSDALMVNMVLTEKGVSKAERILREDGYPIGPLDDHNSQV